MTTVARTLLDLAAVLGRRQVELAVNEAGVRRFVDPVSLSALLARYPGRRGVRMIRSILADRAIGSTVIRSELEARFRVFLTRHRLPRPESNVPLRVGGCWIEVDCLWRDQHLIAELDGRAFHDTEDAYERDRVRDRTLSVAGWRVVRVTWRHLHEDGSVLAADLRSLLR